MKTKLAVAMTLVVAGVGVGLAITPFAAAQQTVCDRNDFSIPDSEPADQDARSLNAGEDEVGVESVSSVGGSEILHVELVDAGSNGQLNWSVFYEDDEGDCIQFDPTNCDKTTRTEDQDQTCTLDPPNAGVREYHVLFEAGNQNMIEYKTWVS